MTIAIKQVWTLNTFFIIHFSSCVLRLRTPVHEISRSHNFQIKHKYLLI